MILHKQFSFFFIKMQDIMFMKFKLYVEMFNNKLISSHSYSARCYSKEN